MAYVWHGLVIVYGIRRICSDLILNITFSQSVLAIASIGSIA